MLVLSVSRGRVRHPVQDAAFALVEGPPLQEGDVDWEEAVAADRAGDGDEGAGSEGEDEDGGLTAYAAGFANAQQVLPATWH